MSFFIAGAYYVRDWLRAREGGKTRLTEIERWLENGGRKEVAVSDRNEIERTRTVREVPQISTMQQKAHARPM